MNKIHFSRKCLVCDVNLQLAYDTATLVAERYELVRMMGSGLCDPCQRDRLGAAVEYERACSEAAFFGYLGANATQNRQINSVMRQAVDRVRAAEERCIALKMWPANR